MTPIRYIAGDATDPQAAGPKVIAHCCNDLGRCSGIVELPIQRKTLEILGESESALTFFTRTGAW